jgi:hypothetical protein
MSGEQSSHSCGSSGGKHSLDGIRLSLPIPAGRHHAEIVASFARWLGEKHDLEPFDLEVSEAAGKLSFRPLTPAAKARALPHALA